MMRTSFRFREMGKALTSSRIQISESKSSTYAATENKNVTGKSTIEGSDFQDVNIKGSRDDIPGPKAFPIIGNVFRFLPFVGEYADMPMIDQLMLMRKTYGDIVKLDGILNRDPMIFIFNAELSEQMYRQEGVWPTRIAMESLHYYRQNRDNFYSGNYGLTTSQGKMWHDFRSNVNQHMMQPRAIKPHVSQVNQVADEFIEKLRIIRNPETQELPPSFNNELNKWALESISVIALNQRLGCLKLNLSEDSDPQKMINSVHTMFEMMFRLEIMPSLWKICPTPNLKRLFKAVDTMNGLALKYINQAKDTVGTNSNGQNKHERSLLQKLLDIDALTARIMAMDMLTAGVDTSGNSAGAALYYLAVNPEKQEKLREEVMSLLPTKDHPITPDILNNIPYTKACLKESLRLFPVAIGTLRTMPKDIVLGGYKLQKGSHIITGHSVLSRDPEQFPQPDEFIPERWIRNQTEYPSAKTAHPFAYMPFGFGARTCIGRRFAEMELEILLLKMIRNFYVEWHHGPLQCKSRFINTVGNPLEFKIIDLE